MTLFLNCQTLSKAYGSRQLFKNLSFSIFSGEKIGLIGPNGSGKSTLLKMLVGRETADTGIIAPKRGLKIGYVPQTCEFPDEKPETLLIKELNDQENGELIVQTILSKLGFTGEETSAKKLSGGWKKRLSVARELIFSPDVLLLDEPTNHLDLEGILWLEKFLQREVPSYLVVSHDRYFLQKMVNRVIEINPVYPNGLFSINGAYSTFLEKKEEFILGQIQTERSLASKARREQEWLRQSPKARTVKAQSRVDDAHEILGELSLIHQRNQDKKANIAFSATERETQKLLVAKNLSKELDGRTLFNHLDVFLSPGTRIGLMGPNGSGKTTLLRMLAGEIDPNQGTIKKAEGLKTVYFDQHRLQLSDDMTLRQALSPNSDFVNFRGQMIHVNGWCKRFLFSPDILDMSISKLSGGERARITIAHLMLQPADLLLLDEPTNDLDIPTLETLEESLLQFPGAIVLITHDRCMMDRICTSLITLGTTEEKKEVHPTITPKPKEKGPSKAKLSYNEKKEYEGLEDKIQKLEEEIRQLNQKLDDPEISQYADKLQTLCNEIGLAETRIEQLYLRWEELENKLNT
jgi:ATP-binding cassette subfamily F protein uup